MIVHQDEGVNAQSVQIIVEVLNQDEDNINIVKGMIDQTVIVIDGIENGISAQKKEKIGYPRPR